MIQSHFILTHGFYEKDKVLFIDSIYFDNTSCQEIRSYHTFNFLGTERNSARLKSIWIEEKRENINDSTN